MKFNVKNKGKGNPTPPSTMTVIMQIGLIVLSFVWMLAVIKVFLLEGNHRASHYSDKQQMGQLAITQPSAANLFSRTDLEINPVLIKGDASMKAAFIGKSADKKVELTEKAATFVVPTSSEWAFIRASPDYKIAGNREQVVPKTTVEVEAIVVPLKKRSELLWPPVQPDGSILTSDGVDVMPVVGLKVPRFYIPEDGTDFNEVGSKVNGHDTIFLMIASYRDFQCRETITSAYRKSDHPERLFVGAVDQTVPGDTGCLDLEIPCTVDPTQPICVHRDQISVYHMDAEYATGPVTARHVGDRMYRGETFVMQMDAHCLFINHWDTKITTQWAQTGNEMAVLSSYLTDIQGSISNKGDSLRETRPIMCNSDYEGAMPARYLRHGSQPELVAAIREMPQLEPYWAAGFSFSRGHFKLRVPYDAYQPMVFQGEEINVGIRGFTHGYDFYAPRDSVVFHEYAEKSKRRKKIPMFWENSQAHKGEGQKSLRRATALIGMAPGLDPTTYDHSEIERYGIGKVRKLSLFYKLFLIDPEQRKAQQLCPFVTTGTMHNEFQKYLRPDRLGIDYAYLEDFDTAAELKRKGKFFG